jgi:8-oxo-dGTP diphosphatase
MKFIKAIQFKNLTLKEIKRFEIRKAARAIVFDKNKSIGLLCVSKHNYHKLPGGGIEDGEDVREALKRECLEEIGCNIETYAEVGAIIEYRDKWSLKQHSYCYLAKVVGEKGKPSFTSEEIDDGFEIKWLELSVAIELLERDKPDNYDGTFIQIRDSIFLKKAANKIARLT